MLNKELQHSRENYLISLDVFILYCLLCRQSSLRHFSKHRRSQECMDEIKTKIVGITLEHMAPRSIEAICYYQSFSKVILELQHLAIIRHEPRDGLDIFERHKAIRLLL